MMWTLVLSPLSVHSLLAIALAFINKKGTSVHENFDDILDEYYYNTHFNWISKLIISIISGALYWAKGLVIFFSLTQSKSVRIPSK